MHHGCLSRLPPLLLVAGLAFAGCGRGDQPPLGLVTGKVTMNGTPLVGVIVTFKPEKGRPAMGITDKAGTYQLEFNYGVKGAKVGPNTVGFSWPISAAGSQVIPDRYSGKSELIRNVESGRNTFDFDLESEPGDTKKKVDPRLSE